MKKYKNISSTTQELMGVGIVAAGEIIQSSVEINNGNFELVEEKKPEFKQEKKLTKK